MDFTESVDDMIARHFSIDALLSLPFAAAFVITDRELAKDLLGQLILTSLAHARSQVQKRNKGSMTFDQAMQEALAGRAVTRPAWDIFYAIWSFDESGLFSWEFDNTEGTGSGGGSPYEPTDEDRAATDWMPYQTPEDNWVELRLERR